MSYDISINCPCCKQILCAVVPGGIGGSNVRIGHDFEDEVELHVNLTWNYGKFFREVLGDEGVRWLYGKKAGETVQPLKAAIEKLSGEPDTDYWAPTSGNAKAALQELLAMAEAAPGGVWGGD